MLAKQLGVEIRNVSGHGMPNVINSRLDEITETKHYYNINLINHIETSFEAIFNTTANQVRNLPDNLDLLVVSVASGIQISGILLGLNIYNKNVKRVVGVEMGPTRIKKIKNYVDIDVSQLELKPMGIPFSKEISQTIGNGIALDNLYEGKAYQLMKHQLEKNKKKVCFWIVGKRPDF